jgi:SagB-type dehydrogenase family enzyme
MSSDAVLWTYALAPDVTVEARDGGALLRTPTGRIQIEGRRERRILELLAGDGCSEADGRRQLLPDEPDGGAETSFAALMYRLDRAGLLARRLNSPGGRLVSCIPLRPPPGALPECRPQDVVRLSPRALAWSDGGVLSVERPGAWARLRIDSRALLPLLHDLAIDRPAGELAAGIAGCSESAILAALALMRWCGLLDSGGQDDGWSSHDLLFHVRTRYGYARTPLGKLSPADERADAPGTSAVAVEGAGVVLPVPDLQRLVAGDPPFASVSERRRSTRQQGSVALTLDQLSEFLFRTLHERGGRRPYPSGGSRYPLNCYLMVHRCGGLPRGLYAYHPARHDLIKVEERGAGLDRMLADAAAAADVGQPPQILLVLAARHARTGRMYGQLTYSLILKEVGAVFQAAMMSAAVMGLAACPLGCGNSLLFSDLLGVNPLTETSVGELMLGTLADAT